MDETEFTVHILNLGNTASQEVNITLISGTDWTHLSFSILKHRVQGQWSFLLQTTDEKPVRSVRLALFGKRNNFNRS